MSGHRQTPTRVLIVDDDSACRSALRNTVAATTGFEVAGVAGSGEALEFVMAIAEPQLVLLDASIPELNRVAVALRRRHPDVRVVLLSASGADPSVGIENKLDVSPEWLAALWEQRRRSR